MFNVEIEQDELSSSSTLIDFERGHPQKVRTFVDLVNEVHASLNLTPHITSNAVHAKQLTEDRRLMAVCSVTFVDCQKSVHRSRSHCILNISSGSMSSRSSRAATLLEVGPEKPAS